MKVRFQYVVIERDGGDGRGPYPTDRSLPAYPESSAEDLAVVAAEDWFSQAGRESSWPLTFQILIDGSKFGPPIEVEMQMQPCFVARTP